MTDPGIRQHSLPFPGFFSPRSCLCQRRVALGKSGKRPVGFPWKKKKKFGIGIGVGDAAGEDPGGFPADPWITPSRDGRGRHGGNGAWMERAGSTDFLGMGAGIPAGRGVVFPPRLYRRVYLMGSGINPEDSRREFGGEDTKLEVGGLFPAAFFPVFPRLRRDSAPGRAFPPSRFSPPEVFPV